MHSLAELLPPPSPASALLPVPVHSLSPPSPKARAAPTAMPVPGRAGSIEANSLQGDTTSWSREEGRRSPIGNKFSGKSLLAYRKITPTYRYVHKL